MNLKQLQKDAKKFFKQLKSKGLLGRIEYRQVSGSSYDVTKGEETQSYDTMFVNSYLTGYTRRELSDAVRLTDTRALVLSTDFELMPQIKDEVVFNDQTYTVIDFINNPFEAVIELQLRSA